MLKDLPIDLVHPSPTNPRKRFNQVKLQELADSIKAHDVMQPIVVRPMPGLFETYEIVAGERRWRGSKLAEKQTIPAMVRELSDFEVLQLQVIENAQRDDLHALEEARGFKAILDDQNAENWSADQLAEKVGKSRTYIYNTLKLNDLCLYAQDKFLDDRFGREIALLIARIPGEKLQTEATKEIITPDWQGNTLSFRAAQKLLRDKYTLKLASAPFKITDENLVPSAGSCKTCPSRSGNCPETFPDIESPDVCTDTECFGAKKAAHIEQLKESGNKVVDGNEAKKIMPHSWDLNPDYVKLEDNCPGKSESLQKVLGKDTDCVITVVDQNNGNLVKVAKKTDIKEALQAKGIDITFGNTRNYSEEQKEKEREIKLENAYRLNLMRYVSDSLKANLEVDWELEEFEQTIIARSMLNSLDHETGKRLLRLLAIPFTTEDGPYKAKEQLLDSVASMPTPQRLLLMMQIALIGECHANEYSMREPKNLIQTAEHYGIDMESVRTSTLEQATSKMKAAKNSKTAPTPVPAAQAQELNAPEETSTPFAQAANAAAPVETSKEDIAPGALPFNEPADVAGNASPASAGAVSTPAPAPLSNFEKIKARDEVRLAKARARREKSESAKADAQSSAGQESSETMPTN